MSRRRKVKVTQLGSSLAWFVWCPTCLIGDLRRSWRSAIESADRHAGYHVSEPPC